MTFTRHQSLALSKLLDRLGFPDDFSTHRYWLQWVFDNTAGVSHRVVDGCADAGLALPELCQVLVSQDPQLAGAIMVLALEEGSRSMAALAGLLLEHGAPAAWTDSAGW